MNTQGQFPVQADDVRMAQEAILRRTWSSVLRHLPALAVSGVVTSLAIGLSYMLVGGMQPIAPIVAALLVGPTLMPLFAVVQGALVDDDTELRRYFRDVRRFALRSAGYALVVGGCFSIMLVAFLMYEQTRSVMAIFSIGASVTCSVLALVGLAAVLPAAVARPEVRGARLWITALHLVGRWPVRFLAPLVVSALAMWVAASLASSLVLLLPAPVAILAGAAYWCCAVELGAPDVMPLEPARA